MRELTIHVQNSTDSQYRPHSRVPHQRPGWVYSLLGVLVAPLAHDRAHAVRVGARFGDIVLVAGGDLGGRIGDLVGARPNLLHLGHDLDGLPHGQPVAFAVVADRRKPPHRPLALVVGGFVFASPILSLLS